MKAEKSDSYRTTHQVFTLRRVSVVMLLLVEMYYPLGGLKPSKMVPGALRPDLATVS